jgi:hypothetical protein
MDTFETLEDLWEGSEFLGPREALKAAKARRAEKLARWVEAQEAQKKG